MKRFLFTAVFRVRLQRSAYMWVIQSLFIHKSNGAQLAPLQQYSDCPVLIVTIEASMISLSLQPIDLLAGLSLTSRLFEQSIKLFFFYVQDHSFIQIQLIPYVISICCKNAAIKLHFIEALKNELQGNCGLLTLKFQQWTVQKYLSNVVQ